MLVFSTRAESSIAYLSYVRLEMQADNQARKPSMLSSALSVVTERVSAAVEWLFDDVYLRQEKHNSNPHNLNLTEIIGKGAAGWVRRSYDPIKLSENDEEVYYAGKTILLLTKGTPGYHHQVAKAKREIRALRECSKECEFVVRFIDAFFDGERHIEVGTELCEVGSLFDVLAITRVRGETLRSVMYCVVSAIAHVHRLGYIHGDVKPANFLMTRQGMVKLCDFGVVHKAKSVETDSFDVGTLRFAPPEILPRFLEKLTYRFDQKRDIWPIGLIAQDIFYGPDLPKDFDVEHPELSFDERMQLSDESYNFYKLYHYPKGTPSTEELWVEIVEAEKLGLERAGKKGEVEPDLVDFVRSCLAMEPANRLSATELLNGRYIAKQKTKLYFRQHLARFAKEVVELQEELKRKWIEENGEPERVRGLGGIL